MPGLPQFLEQWAEESRQSQITQKNATFQAWPHALALQHVHVSTPVYKGRLHCLDIFTLNMPLHRLCTWIDYAMKSTCLVSMAFCWERLWFILHNIVELIGYFKQFYSICRSHQLVFRRPWNPLCNLLPVSHPKHRLDFLHSDKSCRSHLTYQYLHKWEALTRRKCWFRRRRPRTPCFSCAGSPWSSASAPRLSCCYSRTRLGRRWRARRRKRRWRIYRWR